MPEKDESLRKTIYVFAMESTPTHINDDFPPSAPFR